ncbi:MAG: ComF family protein [Desulfatibacillaceae bacterium]|nr:ComF family protein [Desulfatibacillaceae bacterium]
MSRQGTIKGAAVGAIAGAAAWAGALAGLGRRTAGALARALYPPVCIGCGSFMDGVFTIADAGAATFEQIVLTGFCPDCVTKIKPVSQPFCTVCGEPFASQNGPNHTCGRCMENRPAFATARAALIYDGPAKNAILSFKYARRMALARPLSLLCQWGFLRYYALAAHDLALPVPLHGRRLGWRGFNQAWLLMEGWKKDARFPTIDRQILRRIRNTPVQAGMNKKQRAQNIRGAFAVSCPQKIKGKRILLVDDVLTTGETARECARVLAKNGAARVDILTLARVEK